MPSNAVSSVAVPDVTTAFSSGINLILIITILVCNTLVNKVTGASLDKGIGG